jgi:hypothetical protein
MRSLRGCLVIVAGSFKGNEVETVEPSLAGLAFPKTTSTRVCKADIPGEATEIGGVSGESSFLQPCVVLLHPSDTIESIIPRRKRENRDFGGLLRLLAETLFRQT